MTLHPLQAEWDGDLAGGDPLGFPGYAPPDRESVLTGRTEHYAVIEGRFDVMGGSMGAVHGERVVRAFKRAADERLPVVVATSSGGARMQEGMVALVQMARTAAAARDHADAGLLQVAIHRSPTTGGVFASYGSLGDVRAAEPGAVVGFAGPRVVEQLLDISLPAGSHTSESAFRHGLVDALVPEGEQAAYVEAALGLVDAPLALPDGRPLSPTDGAGDEADAADAWAQVERARDERRPTGLDWAAQLCASWTELRGVDPVVRTGLATLELGDRTPAGSDQRTRVRAVVVATDRFAGAGRPGPAGYRLAQRAIALAGRLGLPVVTLVDTPGAELGPDAEAEGIAGEIARTFAAMAAVDTKTVAVCVGEGGSGGALALAAADQFLMLRQSVFSVIGPEGAAAILLRDAGRAAEVAAWLRLTAPDLLELGIVDGVVDESVAAVRASLAAALDGARPGQRRDRFDRATARWLR